ncbi:iron aquisition yersiniabactin synthesis enzyme (Irp12Cpolyketide synthetase) [gamma proteobacterium IMCC2047]|nr:iron aquisition yersiniabactin synthesis enzyme (Irp12Cpolyketide synthetase) [gamma proteobacterium IMCC2047]
MSIKVEQIKMISTETPLCWGLLSNDSLIMTPESQSLLSRPVAFNC